MGARSLQDFFWPPVKDLESSGKAADQGFMAAILYLVVSLGVTAAGQPLKLLDVLMVALCGALTKRKRSRAAALIGLALMTRELWFSLGSDRLWHVPLAALLVVLFANAVRGTFRYHRELSGERTSPTVEVLPPESPPGAAETPGQAGGEKSHP